MILCQSAGCAAVPLAPQTYTLLNFCHLYPWNWFYIVICWVLTWCWCDFLRGHKTGLKSAQTSSWQLLLCPAGFHFITTAAVSHAALVHSQNHSEIVGKAGNQMLWDFGKLCRFKVTQSVLHRSVCVESKLNSAHKCEETSTILPPNQYLYLQHFTWNRGKKRLKKEVFFFFWRLKPPFLFKINIQDLTCMSSGQLLSEWAISLEIQCALTGRGRWADPSDSSLVWTKTDEERRIAAFLWHGRVSLNSTGKKKPSTDPFPQNT